MKNNLFQEWSKILLLEISSPYIFRTRLERTVKHTLNYTKKENDEQITRRCQGILEKLQYISDQSNQTADGCLNSYRVLKEDMLEIQELLCDNKTEGTVLLEKS